MAGGFNAVNSLVNNWGMGVEGNIPDDWFESVRDVNNNILEVGYGKGSLLKRFQDAGCKKLYGLDASQINLRHAQSQGVEANLLITDISTERFQFPDGHFQVVVLLEVLEHIMSPIHCILELKRVLRAGGTFIFSFPEERLISGIGKEEDNNKREYGDGFHSFPYPGLFKYENMRVFLNQMYFKIVDERQDGYHIFFKMENMKVDRPEILDVVNMDFDGRQLYGDVVTEPKIKL